jgi:sterol desaturase/sphingolipid hydroxylase (fatty acid hydroxylase superfamily)
MTAALRTVVAWALFPILVTALATWAVIGATWNVTARFNPSLLIFGTILVAYPLLALLEHLMPYRPEWNRAQGDTRADVLHLLITGPGASSLHEALVHGTFATAGVWLAGRLGGGIWPVGWPAPAQLGLALLVSEFGHYWFHRFSHEQALVWRLHATHHSALRLYWLNATRFHPLDLLCLMTCQSAPLFLLGAPQQTLLMYALFSVVYGQIQHCNVALRTPRVVDWVFSTPGVHRWHHSTDPREGNNNYGAIFSLWDHVFRSFFRPRDPFAEGVGLADMPAFPRDYLGQLASPFRWGHIGRITGA